MARRFARRCSNTDKAFTCAALGHATESVLTQLQMPPETNAQKPAMELLKGVVLKGKVITSDALFCQRALCEEIVGAGGAYLFAVKDNQSDLKSAIAADFTPGFTPPGAEAERQR